MRAVSPAMVLLLTFALYDAAGAQVPPLVGAAATPPQRAVATVFSAPGNLCADLLARFPTVGGPRGDLRDRCQELVVAANSPSLTGDVQTGLQQIAHYQVTGQGTGAVQTSSAQFASITSRLAALRRGMAGFGGFATDEAPALPLVASLAPMAVAASTPSPPEPVASDRLGVFLNGVFATGDKSATAREVGFDFDTAEAILGVDYRFTRDLILGVAFSYAGTRATFASSGGKLDADDFSGSVYGTFYPTDNLYLDGIVSAGVTDYTLTRHIHYAVPSLTGGVTAVDQRATGEPDATWYAVGVTAGYDVSWGALSVSPVARLDYTRTDIDGYRETIPGTAPGSGLPLDIQQQTIDSLTTALGVQLSYAVSTPVAVLVPQLHAEWIHEFLDDARPVRARFVYDPSPSAAQTVSWRTDNPDRDFFTLGVGVSATFARGISAFVYYETVLGLRDVTAHRVAAGIRVTF